MSSFQPQPSRQYLRKRNKMPLTLQRSSVFESLATTDAVQSLPWRRLIWGLLTAGVVFPLLFLFVAG